jgi:Tfp pilus assembly protein PilW
MANWHAKRARGFSLIELMIAIALGMVIVGALLALFVNVTRANNEMTKMNRQIENGRFAIQVMQDDIIHGGYWGSYTPPFDDLTATTAPLGVPNALPDPCLAYASWTDDYRNNLIGIPVQGNVGSCVLGDRLANTDALVVRYAQPCEAGVGTCGAEAAGKLYFQSTRCEDEVAAVAQQPNSATTIKLNAAASATDDLYNGMVIRIIGGTGANQSRKITAYDGTSKVATVASSWDVVPDNSSVYAFGLGYVLGTAGHMFHEKDCAAPAGKRKFASNIYYIRDHSEVGDGIPTLMRASFDGTAYQPEQALIEGIQAFRVQYGIDAKSDTDADVNYTVPIVWADPMKKISPTNRGDGVPENYVNATGVTCAGTGVNQCPAANVVAIRIHVLARSLERTPGYIDSKTYQLGDQNLGPFNDGFKRHVFSTTVRLVNPAGRRDTP